MFLEKQWEAKGCNARGKELILCVPFFQGEHHQGNAELSHRQ